MQTKKTNKQITSTQTNKQYQSIDKLLCVASRIYYAKLV